MATLTFKLTAIPLRHCKNGKSLIVTPHYSGYFIFLDELLVKYLTDIQILIFLNNNMFLVIETDNDKHWRIATEFEGHLSDGGVHGKKSGIHGKIIIKEVNGKIGILCTDFDNKFIQPKPQNISENILNNLIPFP